MMNRALSKSVAAHILASKSGTDLVDAAAELSFGTLGSVSLDTAEVIAESLAGCPSEATRTLRARLNSHREAPAQYLAAKLAQQEGLLDEAAERLGVAISLTSSPQPHILALRARWLVREARFSEAFRDLHLALECHPQYGFYARTERIVDSLLRSDFCAEWRKVRVAILASSTTSFLVPVLRTRFFARRIMANVRGGTFGTYKQDVLDPSSWLYEFAPDIVVVLPNHRDLGLPPSGRIEAADATCYEFQQLWEVLRQRLHAHVVHVGFDLPRGGGWGDLESTLRDGRRRLVAQINDRLSARSNRDVSFLDIEGILSGAVAFDPKQWHETKQHPSSEFLPAFAEAACGTCRAALGLSSKVLVLDLDNTLWGGVIGEDGLGGIRVGPPTAQGEAFADLQLYAQELKARGVLLAVCSKNNSVDARSPFESHESMVLRLDDFASFVASWDDKATALRRIADELSLGLDSFVFLDDNPVERAWIRDRLPEVAVPECGSTPWDMLEALRRGHYFDAAVVTDEDLARHTSYAAGRRLREVEKDPVTLENFLKSLHMIASHGPVAEQTLDRVTQLINKTNQFNLTTRRHGASAVREFAAARDVWFQWFRLRDRFTDHGIVGVMMARIAGDIWHIDTWLMSCRVLGRGMEAFMCAQLLAAAKMAGATAVTGEFVPTAKNANCSDTYQRMGFARDGDGRFRFVLGEGEPPLCSWIRTADQTEPG